MCRIRIKIYSRVQHLIISVMLACILYEQGLAWQFTAETVAILVAELIVGLIAMRGVQTMAMAWCVLMVYPASLLLVSVMESYGFD